jgi:hypothetical protein
MPTSLPAVYRVFFTTIDPLLATTGIVSLLTTPETFLVSYFPNPKIAPETRFALDALTGFFASTVVLQVCLLRLRPDDREVWKLLQASILVQNATMVGAFCRVKQRAGQLNPGAWTRAEWGKLVGVGVAAAIRLAFVCGVGLS